MALKGVMNSRIIVLTVFLTLFTMIKLKAQDSIAIKVKVKQEQKMSTIKSKGDYSLKLCTNDTTRIDLQQPTNGLIYINDTLLSVEKSRIEVKPINYFLSKYRIRRKHFTISSTKRDVAVRLSYKRNRYGLSNLLIRLRLKQSHCHNGSVW